MKLLKKKIYIFNIKSLINSNLLLIKTYNKNLKTNEVSKLSNSLFFLEPLNYLQNLKQTVRILQFLKNKKSSYLYIDIMDSFFKQILTSIFTVKKKSNISLYLIKSYYRKRTNEQLERNKKNCEFYWFLNENSFSIKFVKYLFLQKIFLIQSINSNFEFNDLNTYKFYNDLNHLKNFFFLMLFLKKNL
jgi:hypothetical protein